MRFSHTIRPKTDDRLSLSFVCLFVLNFSAPKLLEN